jgi:hypothetical protein
MEKEKMKAPSLRVLTLNVKGEYFDQMANRTKLEEYRNISPYWQKRLMGKTYDVVVIKKGYPKNSDTARILRREWQGVRIVEIQHKEFGPNPINVFGIGANGKDVGDNQ